MKSHVILAAVIIGMTPLLLAHDTNDNASYLSQNQTRDFSEFSQSNMSGSTSARDSAITADIRAALANDPTLSQDAQNIFVSVTDRNVTLTGNVQTNAERKQVEQLVRKVPAVRRISNRLQIAR